MYRYVPYPLAGVECERTQRTSSGVGKPWVLDNSEPWVVRNLGVFLKALLFVQTLWFDLASHPKKNLIVRLEGHLRL